MRLFERSFSDECLLLRELTHRIKNEYASAISIISLAAAHSANEEVKTALAAVEDRLQNYAQVHRALQMPEYGARIDATAYVRQLCRAISRSKLDCRGIELVLVEHQVWMSSERCWRLGMIVSELITNAAQHAFRGRGGVIRVELLPQRSIVECRITDNGMTAAAVRPGSGLAIVEALTKGLDGQMEQQFGPQGATSILRVPICPLFN
jgi:two-component sensor histidine kinase